MNRERTAGRQAKKKGITIKRISDLSNVSPCTLDNWFKNRPELFDIVIDGSIIKNAHIMAEKAEGRNE